MRLTSHRGIDSHHEHQPHALLRDTRPFGTRMAGALFSEGGAFAVYGAAILWLMVMPAPVCSPDLVLISALFYALFCALHRSNRELAFRPAPEREKLREGDGIFLLGNCVLTGREIWLSKKDVQTHFLEIGTTGSGKTKALLAKLANALCWGSGGILVDGKGDVSLWAEVNALCRRFGREDDLLVLNFLGSADEGGHSHTINPLASATPTEITELLTSLAGSERAGDSSMWRSRANALMKALIPPLVWLRDRGDALDVSVIRAAMPLPAVIRLSRNQDIPHSIREGLLSYLDELPGYDDSFFDDEGRDRDPAASQTCREQHNYLTMQWTGPLEGLSGTYSRIFRQNIADIFMEDVVLNRRILLVLLPALEKSPDEVANLGRIVVATLKGMMARQLGSSLEGKTGELTGNRSGSAPSPYLCLLDEVGHYTTPGMGVMAAQGRSTGIAMVFAAQDIPSMRKRIQGEADSIIANCNTKIFMKLEDPTDTRALFEKSVGEAQVTQVPGFTRHSLLSSTWTDRMEAVIERRLRADFLDLKAQKEGEAHILVADRIIRAKLLYTPLPLPGELRMNVFLHLPDPRGWDTPEEIHEEEMLSHPVVNPILKGENLPRGDQDLTERLKCLLGHLRDFYDKPLLFPEGWSPEQALRKIRQMEK